MKTQPLLWITVGLLWGAQATWGQDDIYYFPSKHAQENNRTTTLSDTSGKTAYEKYRALKEGENVSSKEETMVPR
jgi:hypothetical protein